MMFLLAFAAALFYVLTQENARILAQRVPGLARSAGGDARSVLYLVAAGIIFVAAVFVIEILETHKTAGVVYKVTAACRRSRRAAGASRSRCASTTTSRTLRKRSTPPPDRCATASRTTCAACKGSRGSSV